MIRPDKVEGSVGAGGPPVPFRLWPFQVDVMRHMASAERLIVLKARQLGISWLYDAYALWLCSSNRGQTVLMISKGLREAKLELERVQFMHNRLPGELKRETGIARTDLLEFPEMDSRILSLPAGEDIGTSFTATLAIVQELSKMRTESIARSVMTALEPTVAAGGQLAVVSTARGFGGVFHDMWRDAEPQLSPFWEPSDADSEYEPVFIRSSAHPQRQDPGWRARQRGRMLSDRDMSQEYPETPGEAFQASGDTVFGESFDRARHVPGPYRRPVDSPFVVVRSIDFGWHYSPVHWHEVVNGREVFTFAEMDAQHLTVDQLCEAIIERERAMGLKSGEISSGIDPAGEGRTDQTGQANTAYMARHGLRVMVGADGKALRVDPDIRVDLMQGLLQQGRWRIALDECPKLVEALEKAEWLRHGKDGPPTGTYKKDGKYEHYLDGCGYGLINVFPPQAPPGAAETIGAPMVVYSESEFG